MNEIILLLLAIVGIFSIACSVALIALGKIIDLFPIGNEATRIRSITSPIESTKIAVVFFWVAFIPGAWAILQEGIFTKIAGITILFSICLFMFTALVFSFAVLSAMKKRKNAYDGTALCAGITIPETTIAPKTIKPEPVVIQKRQKNPLSNLMVHALLKK
jgi:hypothetical protein